MIFDQKTIDFLKATMLGGSDASGGLDPHEVRALADVRDLVRVRDAAARVERRVQSTLGNHGNPWFLIENQ